MEKHFQLNKKKDKQTNTKKNAIKKNTLVVSLKRNFESRFK